MRKYFTWRCIGLHAITLIVVPGCLFAAWWQYHVALGGNAWGWVYTIEWPFFAVAAVYMWWGFIHDMHMPFNRLRTAKQHAATDASGTPLYQIPGWAVDKDLSQAVVSASVEAARARALSLANPIEALESADQEPTYAMGTGSEAADSRILEPSVTTQEPGDDRPNDDLPGHAGLVIDAQVTEVPVVRTQEDEQLDAYNRYLFDLSWSDAPKRWGLRRGREPGGADMESGTPVPAPAAPVEGQRRELPSGGGNALREERGVEHGSDDETSLDGGGGLAAGPR